MTIIMQRDVQSNALLSTDRAALDKYRLEKQKLKRMSDLEHEVHELRAEIGELTKQLNLFVKKDLI